MPLKQSKIDYINETIARGELWKAKCILQGIISQSYNHQAYLMYGELLLKTNDLLEAGKYLFLSGSMLKEHEKSIKVFLTHNSNSPFSLLSSLPKKARFSSTKEYPKSVQIHFKEVGITENELARYKSINTENNRPASQSKMELITITLIVSSIVLCLIVGICTIIYWLWNIFY